MAKRISLFGRKRIGELLGGSDKDPADSKRTELLAMKLDQISAEATESGDFKVINLNQIQPDPNQPRKTFKDLDALAQSVKTHGVIQPIIVTQKKINNCHQIISGERRYHASKRAGLKTIPCVLRDGSDANILLLQLLENDQREDVSPIEEGLAVAYLVEKLKMPKGEVAKELGRDAAWVSIRLGLSNAPELVQKAASDGLIDDARTLHELRKLADESPKKAEDLVEQMRKNQISGSYRAAISQSRKKTAKGSAKKAARKPRVPKIQQMEKVGDALLLHIGSKNPVSYTLPKDVLVQFLASVSFDN